MKKKTGPPASRKIATHKTNVSTMQSKNSLVLRHEEGKNDDFIMAEISLSPIAANASTARVFAKGAFGENDITSTVSVMREKAEKVQAGDLSEVEATLTAQAVTLDAMFNEMARRAALNMGTHMQAMEVYMRIALKAQSQCRTTLEALAEIKNPRPVAFVKQANIAHGPQQVNNDDQSMRAKVL